MSGLIDVTSLFPTVDPNGLRNIPQRTENATFFETLGASVGRFDPFISNVLDYDPDLLYEDPEFDVAQSIFDLDPSYHQYVNGLAFAKNADHLDYLIGKIDQSKQRDEVLANSTIGNTLMAAIFDPVNLIALPVGVGRTALSAGYNVAKANAALQVAEEVVVASSDPNARDLKQSAMNVGFAAGAGFALGGIVGFATSPKSAETVKKVEKAMTQESRAFDPSQPIPEEGIATVDETFDFSQRLSDYGPVGTDAGIPPLPSVTPDAGTVKNAFTNSYLNKFLTSPFKRNMTDDEVPLETKQVQYMLDGDMGQLAAGHQNGEVLGISVFADQAEYQAEMHKFYMGLQKAYVKSGKTVTRFLDYAGGPFKNKDFEKYRKYIGRMHIEGRKPTNQADEEALRLTKEFVERWEERLRDTGQIGSVGHYRKSFEFWNRIIGENEEFLRQIDSGEIERPKWYRNSLKERIQKHQTIRNGIQDTLQRLEGEKVVPDGDPNFFPRNFKVNKIKKEKKAVIKILEDHYVNNPEATIFAPEGPKTKVPVSSSRKAARKRAEKTVNKIINDPEMTDGDLEKMFFGQGKSKHFMHRTLDIPNKLLVDYIEEDPLTVFMAYNAKVAPRYSFAKKFGGKTIQQIKDEQMDIMVEAGLDEAKINRVLSDLQTSYDRVMNKPLRNPQRWDATVVKYLKDIATFNYMGAVGLSSIPEIGRIIAEHGLSRTFAALIARHTDEKVKLAVEEGRKAGEALEGALFSTAMRFSDEQAHNPMVHNLWEQGKEAFYILNGLTPITRGLKNLDAIVRQDSIINMAIKEAAGNAEDWELDYLRRYGISKQQSKQLANNKGSAWQRSDSGLIYANTDEWTDEALKESFQRAMSSGILNTIMNATPADRPVMADGVALIPMRVARQFGMKEDPAHRGYARIESAFLSLPFQFYSYSLAAINKTTQAYTTGQMKSPLAGTLVMMGLGYASLELKSQLSEGSRRAWDNLPWTDKLIRSFDQSGAIAFYTDMFYTSIATSMAMTGENYLDGYVKPKFPEEQGFFNTVNQFAGAGPSVAQDYYDTFSGLLNGDPKYIDDAIKMIPGMKLFFVRALTNGMLGKLDDSFDDEMYIGYGRY